MPPPATPAEIARETLKMLMTRRMVPSPDNYREIYNEIAGIGEAEGAFPERELKALVATLPKEIPLQQRLARELDQALKGRSMEAFRKVLSDFVKERSAESERNWGEVIAELLRQWEAKQAGLTQARKRESLEHVLGSAAKNSEILFNRLQGLARSWAQNSLESDITELVEGDIPAPEVATPSTVRAETPPPGAVSRASELLPELRDLFVLTLESAVAAQLEDEPELAAEERTIAVAVRGAGRLQDIANIQTALKQLTYRLEFVSEDRHELRAGLRGLLQLMLENISELVVDDRWLSGQVEMVREIIARPMNIRAVHDAEYRIKELIYKQSQLKHSLIEARESLKQMLAGFVDHLGRFADSTSDYHDKIERCVEKISQADDISQLEDALAEVIQETRTIQLNAQRSRDELQATRLRVEAAEKRVIELQEELDRASTLVRHDQLTGTLNRRGLEEAFENEVSRANRRRSPLCVALLDIDNFKKLNDSLGHDAGDAALIHLATVTRETMRPQDTVARFGGEEFIILLPDTPLPDAQKAMIRLQRELTRRIFLHENEKVLITFSAGVTDFRPDDNQATVTRRADEAMYQAKKTGKNRVVIG